MLFLAMAKQQAGDTDAAKQLFDRIQLPTNATDRDRELYDEARAFLRK